MDAHPRRVTYGHIQIYCRREYGFVPATSWIADLLAEANLTRRQAPNRNDPKSVARPCPPHRRSQLAEAIRSLGIPLADRPKDS